MSAAPARQRTFTKAPDPVPAVSVRPAAQAVQRTPAPARREREAEASAQALLRNPYLARFADAGALVARAGERQAAPSGDGKRMYRTLDGKEVELPADLTAEEAAQLERDGSVAQKRLGQGPPPAAVPDAKKLAKKGEKRERTRPQGRGRRSDRGRGKALARPAAAAAMLLGAVGQGAVARYLAAKGAPVLARGISRLGKLRQNEQTHDDAAEKLNQSEQAVVIPAAEDQAKGNTHQVETVEGRPAPAAEETKAKQRLTESLEQNIPQSIEDVDNFKRDQKARHMGADVMKVVQGDSNAVTSTFGDVKQTPPPAPSEHVTVGLPPTEVAPATGAMNLGQGAVAPLQSEHTDVSNFTKEADGKLKEEGVTQEHLDMVDSGDLAEANKEKKGLETKAKAEPLAIQKFATQQAAAVDAGLQAEEKVERERLKARRRGALGATADKQRGTKSALEKKRDEVAAKINGIYKTAQDNVTKKLAALETESMKRFDSGNERATKAFEENVHRELEAYKDDRYSGWFGWARKAKDWLLGMDELPRVKAIFDTNRKAFVDTINRLVEGITADQKRVIAECKQELADAKRAIKEYVDKLGPDLRSIGKKAAGEMEEKLAALDNLINEKEQELAAKLKDKQTAAIKAIDEKIAKMKEAMSGALAKLGKLLLLAAKKFFSWALEKAGFSLATIEGIINKGVAVLKAIFTGPIQFVKRLISAASTGFKNFGKNFLTHLKNAVFTWLTGSLEGVTLPESWSFQGIVSVIFQLVGLTYQNIRARLVRVIPEPAVKALETTFTLVKTLVTQGPMAAWEQLKEIAGEMKDAFVDAVKDWIKSKLVEKAIETIFSLLVPGAGFVRAIIGIYDTIVFFIQKAKDILQMIGNFLGSIADIAAGNIGAAAAALEEGLARGLKLVIDFLARFLRLSGITAKIRETIQTIRGKVEAVIDKVVAWIVAQAKKLGKLAVSGARSAAAAVTNWWRARSGFNGPDGKSHTVSVDREGGRAAITVRSVEQTLQEIVRALPAGERRQKLEAHALAIDRLLGGDEPTEALQKDRHDKLQKAVNELAATLGAGTVPSVVSNVVMAGKRASRVVADPLTLHPGNTRGSPAQGEIEQRELFFTYVEPTTRERTIKGKPVTVESLSKIHGTHLLSEHLHGPAETWNLVNASVSANMEMKNKPEEKAKSLRKRGFGLKYVTEVKYHSDAPPPPLAAQSAALEAVSKDNRVATVRAWLGYYFARVLEVALSIVTKPPGEAEEAIPKYAPIKSDIESLPLRGVPETPLTDMVYAAAREKAGAAGGRVESYEALAKRIGRAENKVHEAIQQLAAEGRFIQKGRFYYIGAVPVVEGK